ncbi:MAG TPA: tetratricopeptide repeat protein, partial [Xanthomonadales bacterium]|nr:tetratricopeptide repeat protein [Xanthomonadales bacterium]
MNEQHSGDTGTPNLTPGQVHSGKERRFGKQRIILLVLALLALGTIFLLPRFVSEPRFAADGSGRAASTPQTASTVRPSTAAEKTRYRQQSQSVLAEIIAVRDRLLGQGVNTWADIEFNRAMQWVDEGDLEYSYGNYAASLEQFNQALELLTDLEEQAAQKLEQALAKGLEAIESLNPNVAKPARDLAVVLAPENPDVQALDTRLQTLPEVAALIEAGDEARARGKLAEAQQAYEEAVALDPMHNRAAESLSSIRAEVTDSQFRQHMSRGYAALDGNRFDDARAAFKEAAGIYPGHTAVAQALAQLENRDSQVTVTQQLQQAAALEAAEQWQDAVTIYESLLEKDPSLSEVRAR